MANIAIKEMCARPTADAFRSLPRGTAGDEVSVHPDLPASVAGNACLLPPSDIVEAGNTVLRGPTALVAVAGRMPPMRRSAGLALRKKRFGSSKKFGRPKSGVRQR